MKRLKIIAIGDELLNGSVSDTNSAEISRSLDPLGFKLDGIIVVPDKLNDIVNALKQSGEGVDLLITTGGLGPTSDDLTREAVAEFVETKLEESAAAKTKLEDFFKKRGRQIAANNYRQIFFPKGAKLLPNDMGTADGFVSFHPALKLPIISLPGVPMELNWLLENGVGQWIGEHFGAPSTKIVRNYLRIFGVSESFLGTQIESLKLPAEINVAYRPMSPEILLTVSVEGEKLKPLLDQVTDQIRSIIGDEYIFSKSKTETLPELVASLLLQERKTIAFAESCSGGKIADLLTSIPGISPTFLTSVVTYSNESKSAFANVAVETLERYGAVSVEVAREMACGIRERSSADLAASVTGIAGPDGGSAEKPVGTFFVGLADSNGVEAYKFFMPVERNLFRSYAAFTALDLVRRKLTGLQLDWVRQ